MGEYTLTKLLGGVANGLDVPPNWFQISEWKEAGTDRKSIYEKRSFFHGADRFDVWVSVDVPQEAFWGVMFWQRELYRGDLVAAQKDVIRESISAATNYTNIIMVVGYAALVALLSNGKEVFTPPTFFFATIFLALSVFTFIAWEIYGMIIRSWSGIKLSQAVDNSETFEQRMATHRESMAETMRRLQPIWVTNVAVSAGCGLVSFVIMVSAYIHAAWHAV